MIKFEQALEIVLSNSLTIDKEMIDLSKSMGHVLSSPIFSDRDMPPFNKSAVDGYACIEKDLKSELIVIENIPAGYLPKSVITSGFCSKIMTGAKIPEGADTVIMVEEVVKRGDKIKYLQSGSSKPKNNICFKGEDLKKGELVIEQGRLIKPEQIAILAALGVSQVPVYKQIQIGIISTGDEIVEPETIPTEVQIRNSNGWQLRAQALRMNIPVDYHGIVPDNEVALKKAMEKALSVNNILVMTGGVSMGDFDYVPSVLKDLGFEILFDKVAVQPGKPSTFAIKRGLSNSANVQKAVFALPGNPVSSYIQFELLVKPYILKSMGSSGTTRWLEMVCSQNFTRKNTARKALIPVKIEQDGRISIIEYNGSAHIAALDKADAIAEVPIGVSTINEGDKLRIFLMQ